MRLSTLLCLGFSVCTALAVAVDGSRSTAGATTYVVRPDATRIAGNCVPRPFPACYSAPPGSIYWCPLTPDEIARITCTGPYAN